jgi:hypothetical protein
LSKQPGLPHNCFISEEAVNWCIQEVDGVKNLTSAIALMQVCLLKEYLFYLSDRYFMIILHNLVSAIDHPDFLISPPPK